MIEKIIDFSIRNKRSVLSVSLLVFLIGVFQMLHLSIDALPDVTNVQVSVVTKSPGLSPSEVEQFITYPIELSLNGVPQVQQIRSISRTGVSSVTVIFKENVDIYFARQLVNERLRAAEAEIPAGYGHPELSPITTALGDIYEMNLTSDRHSPEELRTYLTWELAPKLKAVPGVIDINVFGGHLKQYQIVVEPAKLAQHILSLNEILESLKATNLNVGGGYIQKGPEQWVIRGEAQIRSLEDLRNVSVKTTSAGTPLLLKQIAEVRIGHALRFGATTRAGQGEVVGMTIIMLKGQNSREVVNAVRKTVDALGKKLPEGMRIDTYYDRSEFIQRTLSTITVNLIEGALLVLVILLICLGSLKGGFLVALAIPFSMLVAIIFMRQFGIVGNLMSLGAIDFGLLVDGAVVMLESVFATARVLQGKGKSNGEIVGEGCKKVARAATYSVAIIFLVYLPLLALDEVEGKLFRPMATTMSLALAAALIFSITTFPAMLALAFRTIPEHKAGFWENLEAQYALLIGKTRKSNRTFMLIGAFVLISAFLSLHLGNEFIPRIDEGEIAVDVKRLPSTSIEHSRDLNVEIEKILTGFPEVLSVVSRMGRGESASEPIGTEEGEIMVKVKDKKHWKTAHDLDSLMKKMKDKILDHVPSSYISMSQPIENRVNEVLAGSKADFVVKIYGNDLLKLRDLAERVALKLNVIPGTGDLRVQRVLGLPLLEVRINREKISRYGVRADEVLTAVKSLRVGAEAGRVFEGLRRFDIVLILGLDPTQLEIVENIPVMTHTGNTVPLGMVADVQKVEGPAAIYREGLKRRIFVEVNVRGSDLGSYAGKALKEIAEISQDLPEGYEIGWGGQYQNFLHAKAGLMVVVPLIALIVITMLILGLKSLRYALAVSMVVPLSVSGGILALFLRGLPFSIPAAVGFIALSGITVLTGIIYSNALRLKLASGVALRDATLQAALESMRPIVITELIAAIGFLPMALSSGAGAEIQRPLATVVIGGLITGTILGQLVLPSLMEKLRVRG